MTEITPGKMDELAVLRSLAETELRYQERLKHVRGAALTSGVILQDHELAELASEREMLLALWRRVYRARPITFVDAVQARSAGAL